MKLSEPENPNEKLLELHPLGLNGLLKTYGLLNFLNGISFWIALAFGIVPSTLILFFDLLDTEKTINLISDLSSLGLTIGGTLVGLSLAGLTLIVSFGNNNLIKVLVKESLNEALKEKKEINFSGYQVIVAKFGYAVIIQVITLIYLLIVIVSLNLNIKLNSFIVITYVNHFALFGSLFLIFYSLLLVGQMVTNIFTLSQMNHIIFVTEEIDEIMKKGSPTSNK